MVTSIQLSIITPSRVFTFVPIEDGPITIGRSLNCEFSVPLEDISREHCLVESDNGIVYITDLKSKNGIWVNRERILPSVRTQITNDCSIVLSNLYTLKINEVDLPVRPGFVLNKVPRDSETVSFQIELSDNKISRYFKKIKNHSEAITMIVGFALALSFIIYQMLQK